MRGFTGKTMPSRMHLYLLHNTSEHTCPFLDSGYTCPGYIFFHQNRVCAPGSPKECQAVTVLSSISLTASTFPGIQIVCVSQRDREPTTLSQILCLIDKPTDTTAKAIIGNFKVQKKSPCSYRCTLHPKKDYLASENKYGI